MKFNMRILDHNGNLTEDATYKIDLIYAKDDGTLTITTEPNDIHTQISINLQFEPDGTDDMGRPGLAARDWLLVQLTQAMAVASRR